MNRKQRLRGLALAALTLAVAACGGGSAEPPGPTSGDPGVPTTPGPGPTGSGSGGTTAHAGLGASNASPTGAAFAWPDGVQVEHPAKGDDPSCVPDDQHPTPPVGHGGLVRVCLGLRNTTLVPVTVTLPAGLVFTSDDVGTQNGVLLTDVDIVLPAGTTTTTFYVPLHLFCLNLWRHPTTDAKQTWQPGPLTDDAALRELLALLAGKTVPVAFDYTLQQILWDITDGTGLTPEDRAALAAL